jgi:hypothetical protein
MRFLEVSQPGGGRKEEPRIITPDEPRIIIP